MANNIQKIIYNMSSVSPVLFIMGIVWILQMKSFYVPIILFSIFVLVNILFCVSFSYGKKHVETMTIIVENIESYDSWIINYVITYLFPFSSFVIKEINLFILLGLSIIIFLILNLVLGVSPNPFLVLKKYHFYKATLKNGVSGYIIISKKKICNKKNITKVYRIFDYFLIDKEV